MKSYPDTARKQSKFWYKWYELTALPEKDGGTFQERELIRKSRFLSVMVACLLAIFIVFIPGCLILPNKYVIVVDVFMIFVCIVALFMNRKGLSTAAGIVLTVCFEGCLCAVVLTTVPFDPPSLQQYELFVFGELLAVSLISARSVFLVALFNSLFIYCTLIWMPGTPELTQHVHQQFIPLLLRPVSVQWLVACATYVWASSTASALLRADRAETIARLQEDLAFERALVAQEKARLENSIQLIVDTHVTSINQGDLSRPIPFHADTKVLWPLVGVIDSLRKRLVSAQRDQHELERYKQAVHFAIRQIQQKDLSIQKTGAIEVDILCYLLLERNKDASFAKKESEMK